jgi:hypothetical protein
MRLLEDIYIVQFIQRAIKERRTQVLDVLENNSVKSMEHYRELMGNLDSLNYLSQEISDLLEKQEINDV